MKLVGGPCDGAEAPHDRKREWRIQLAHDVALYIKDDDETCYRYWGRVPYFGGDPHTRI